MLGRSNSNCIFLYKLIMAFFALFACVQVQAQIERTKVSKGYPSFHGVSFSFMSWQESLQLTDGTESVQTPANIFGNSISYRYEKYFSVRQGLVNEISFFSGSAHQGGSQNNLTYTTAKVPLTALLASVGYILRMNRGAHLMFSGLVVSRNINWPVDSSSGVQASSGASLNYGPLLELKMKMNDNFSFNQKLGSLVSKASTFWSLGLEYTF